VRLAEGSKNSSQYSLRNRSRQKSRKENKATA
jgi:hypothetical protein